MESGSSMSSESKNTGNKKVVKSRRSWSAREEKVLVAALKWLVANGWKTDNGFRVNYLNKLEDAMKEAFPGTDLKGQPHINSRITTWKKFHGSLSSMLRRTGVNFNGTTNMIDCPNDELWDAIVREDSNAVGMRYKSWPHYEAWTEIFGKDRATGEGAEDVMDVVNDLSIDGHHNLPNVDAPTEGIQEDEGTSVNQSDKAASGGKKSAGKKRKSIEGLEQLYDIAGQLCVSTKNRFEDITHFIGYEYEHGEARKRIFTLLESSTDLGIDNKIFVTEKLASKSELLEMFMGFPPDAQARYVERLLQPGSG